MGARNIVSDEEEEYDELRDTNEIEPEDDEEEEVEEGQDEYEHDGFIVDDVDEEEEEEEVRESSDEEMKAKKKKRKKRESEENYELDDDDYELLQEANVTGFHRPKSGSKKFKRLKKAERNIDEDERTGFSDEDEFEERDRTADDEEQLKRTLFGDDEGGPPEDIAEEEEQLDGDEYEGLEEEEDEMADFIVDEDEVDENGQPMRKRKSKKKIPRQAPGISSSALLEAQEIFGDVDELLTRRRQGLLSKSSDAEGNDDLVKRLEDEFEPSVLADKYMTKKDDEIREKDAPERIQLADEIIGSEASLEAIVQEAVWIYEHVFGSSATPLNPVFSHIAELNRETVVTEIINVLKLFHEKKLEVPFIAMYRKESCINLLRERESSPSSSESDRNKDRRHELKMHKALWEIERWDMKWRLLQKRKSTCEASYKTRAKEEAGKDEMKRGLLDSVLQLLREAKSERTLDDIDAKFNLLFPPDEVEGAFKRPKRKSFYSMCRKAGFSTVSQKFGLSAEQFGENLHSMYKKYDAEDANVTPEDVASQCPSLGSGDHEKVLKGARYMASVEISCEPAVREFVRSCYIDKAVVSTKPTSEGNSVIDSCHRYAGIKWLSNKPLKEFEDAQWLLIQKAEDEKLIHVTISLPKDVINEDIVPEFESKYLSDGVSLVAKLWNDQRKLILQDALFKYILPQMEREARTMLTARAKSWLVEDFGHQLWKKVSLAPYRPQNKKENSNIDEGSDEDFELRVMACCLGSGTDPTTFVMLDPNGEIVDVLFTSNFSNPRPKDRGGDKQKEAPKTAIDKQKQSDQQRFLQFLGEHHPHVIVMGASSIQSKYLKDSIYEIIFEMVEHNPRGMREGLDTINVVYADEILPTLYENSQISKDQLPTQRGIVRRAVALGRYLQNPLATTATLCGPGKEILSLKLHKWEDFLSADEKYDAIEQIMVTVTNQVGIDINLAAAHEWMFAPLQFISGLGPRKAAALQRFLLRQGRLYSRRELFTAMGKCVFINAAGFLRVRGTGQAASGNHVMDPLDDTRIHPEAYGTAKEFAKDMYEAEKGKEDQDDMEDEAHEMAIEYVQKNPGLLRNIDITEYSLLWEEKRGTRNRETLDHIRNEMIHGFHEFRVPYAELTQDEEFYLLTGESEDTLSEGKIVQATVRKILNQKVICNVVLGLTGFIMKEELSDENDSDALEKLTEGTILTCRVKSIQKPKFTVDLTCKQSELSSDQWGNGQIKDPYYGEKERLENSEQEKLRKDKDSGKKTFRTRMIVHPLFQNISGEDATKMLSSKDVGEAILRPSSRGPTHLTLTFKIYDGVYAHKDIEEGGKDKRDFTSILRLGKTLKIDDDTYEDLDEVIDRYLDPLVANLKAILAYRKFRRGTKAEVDDLLRREKCDNPGRIPYFLSISHEHPGAFILSYIRSTNPHHEYVGISPKGFKFRKRVFDNLDAMISYFQRHINDLIQGTVNPLRAVAARVMRSPGPGGSVAAAGGASAGSGWGGGGGSTTSSVGAADGGSGTGGWHGNARISSMGWERSSTPGSKTGGNNYDQRNSNVPANAAAGSSLPTGQSMGHDRTGRGSVDSSARRDGRSSRWSDAAPVVGFATEDARNQRWGRSHSDHHHHATGGPSRGGRGPPPLPAPAPPPPTFESNNTWNQSSGRDGWGSRTDEWGSNSGHRVQDSPARAWTVSSGESGWSKQGNDDKLTAGSWTETSKSVDDKSFSAWGVDNKSSDNKSSSAWDSFKSNAGAGGGAGWGPGRSKNGSTSGGGGGGWGT